MQRDDLFLNRDDIIAREYCHAGEANRKIIPITFEELSSTEFEDRTIYLITDPNTNLRTAFLGFSYNNVKLSNREKQGIEKIVKEKNVDSLTKLFNEEISELSDEDCDKFREDCDKFRVGNIKDISNETTRSIAELHKRKEKAVNQIEDALKFSKNNNIDINIIISEEFFDLLGFSFLTNYTPKSKVNESKDMLLYTEIDAITLMEQERQLKYGIFAASLLKEVYFLRELEYSDIYKYDVLNIYDEWISSLRKTIGLQNVEVDFLHK